MNNFIIKRKIFVVLKLAVSFGLICYLVILVDWNRAFSILKVARKFYFIIGVLLWGLGLSFASLRWCLMLRENKVNFSIFGAYKGYLRGMFYNIFLPGVIGGDVIRIGICVFQTECKVSPATSIVILERIGGLFSLSLFLFVSYYFFSQSFSFLLNLTFIRFLLVAVLVFVIFIIASVILRNKLIEWLSRKNSKVINFFKMGLLAFTSLSGRTLLIVLILSGLFQSTDIFASFLFSRAIGLQLSIPVFFGVIPIVYFATILPISLGGVGVREGTMVFLLSRFGVGITEGVVLALLIYINRIIYAIIGGIVEVVESFKLKKLSPADKTTKGGK
jgi:uncharacterized protein (TIRG00374 family)